MSNNIINGTEISTKIKDELKDELQQWGDLKNPPSLTVIFVGENQASQVYVRNKEKACEYIGIKSEIIKMPDTTTQDELMEVIDKLNKDDNVHGILLQMPIPKHIDEQEVLKAIDFRKDVDGFHPMNVGLLQSGNNDVLTPCTPTGIIYMLENTLDTLEGKNCVVIGRSNIVGKPVANMLTAKNATVTVCHSKTKNMEEITKKADVIVCATGVRNTVTKDMVKEGVVIIDVGMNRNEEGKLCGDVDFENIKDIAMGITPVPGGVGPMTIAMLMKNCINAFKQLTKEELKVARKK